MGLEGVQEHLWTHQVRGSASLPPPQRFTEAFLDLHFQKMTATLADPNQHPDMHKQALMALQDTLQKPADVIR
jgi:hypothetical protein